MRRILILLINCVILLTMSSCQSVEEPIKVALLVSEKVLFDDNPFYGGVWEGLVNYCEENDITYDKYIAEYRSSEQLREILGKAVGNGAELVVMPGYFFQELVLEAQEEYPDTSFILLDSTPNNGLSGDDYKSIIKENTVSVMFAEEQAGFLAGYSAVMEGYRELGFFGGMSVPAVIRFGHGYAQGAEYAAKKLNLEEESINLRYIYCSSFVPTPAIQARAELWYMEGTQVIFSCGGSIGLSVIPAAEAAGKNVIGVDTDQSNLSECVITSAVKRADIATYNAIESYFNGDFPGGEIYYSGINNKSIGLEMENSRFHNFTEKDYNEIVKALSTNKENIASNIRKDDIATEDLPLRCVKLKVETMK